MNAFGLHKNPVIAARLHNDKHVVKMNIEYPQMMSTAHRVLDGTQYLDKTANGRNIKRWRMNDDVVEQTLYKASHINHPTNIWVRATQENYMWMYTLWSELAKEYTHRYGKHHASWVKLHRVLEKPPENIPMGPLTTLPQAMPDDVKRDDFVEAYQEYYRKYKSHFSKWTKRPIPQFMTVV
jgi:hypothetical protein